MFNYLATEYTSLFYYLNLFNYITFRTGAAILTSLFFSLIFGEIIISKLSQIQPIGQPIREDGPKNHIIKKSGTPTMGGVLILGSITISIFLWADLSNKFIWICFFSSIIFGYFKAPYTHFYHSKARVSNYSIVHLLMIKNIKEFLPNEDN